MEEITQGVNNMNLGADSHKKNRIQVSNTKKPLFFYVNLAKRYMQQHNEVELSALGMGINHFFCSLIYTLISFYRFLRSEYEWIILRYGIVLNHLFIGCIIYAAIATVVTIAEILKNNGLAVEKKIMTSTVDMKEDSRGRPVQKAKIEILLGKTENFDELMAASAEERDAVDGEEQS
ncbi:hypothetical protein QQP08_027897 [Theobroma cacao]|nr:hypothetical protein QQP08_027897 [Theobroma cacao]